MQFCAPLFPLPFCCPSPPPPPATPPQPSRYFDEGADEVAFLNITGFRDCPLEDLPMLGVLQVRRRGEGVS
jgi:hypothetical protein